MVDAAETAAITALAKAALDSPPEPKVTPKRRDRREWRLLAGVAAVTVASVLLFDVRVQVGERPASAESPPVVAAPVTTPPVQAEKPPSGVSSGGKGQPEGPEPRRFAWAPTAGASGYHVEFFRGAVRVYAKDTTRPELTVPARWAYAGATKSFQPGEYRWYVWPIVSGKRASNAAIQTTVSIPRRLAGSPTSHA